MRSVRKDAGSSGTNSTPTGIRTTRSNTTGGRSNSPSRTS